MEKKRLLFPIGVVFICLLLVGGFVWLQLSGQKRALNAADRLLASGQSEQALSAYAALLQKNAISFLPVGHDLVECAEQGVLHAADAILETPEGAKQLIDQDLLGTIRSQATHPAVSESFFVQLHRRTILAEAAIAEAAGDFEQAYELLHLPAMEQSISELVETEASSARDKQLEAQAWAALNDFRFSEAEQIAAGISDDLLRDALLARLKDVWPRKLSQLHEQKADSLCAGAWYSLLLDPSPRLSGDTRYAALDFSGADAVFGGAFSFAAIKNGHVSLLGDTLGAAKAASEITDAVAVDVGLNHAAVLHADGTAQVLGARQYRRGLVDTWSDLRAVAAGGFHTVGLTAGGAVVATGLNLDGQCNVSNWNQVIAIDAGLNHTAALKADGTVVAVGNNRYGQCNVSGWRNIIDVRCGANFTLGLTADFTVLAVGDNACGQCNVSKWRDIVAIDAGVWHTIGLCADGHIVSTGANEHGQCALADNAGDAPVSESESIYVGDDNDGPWFFCNGDGCVIAAMDEEAHVLTTRADLICTAGISPVGILSGGGTRPALSVTPIRLAKENRAVLALTGDYFTFAYNRDGLQIRQGTVFKEETDECGFAFYPDGSMRIVDPKKETANGLLSLGIKDSWVFGPILIQDGEACDIHGHPLSYNDVTMRSIIASICPHHHIASAFGKSTLADCTKILLGYGADIAYNLDGGRSSSMVFLGKQINRTIYRNEGWRNLQDMIGFLTSESVPKP